MRNRSWMLAVLATTLVAGCDSGPRLVTVTGTVTYKGKPLEGAEVIFSPDPSNTEGLAGNDLTGSSGDYRAMTRGRSGLVPGKYQVTVKKVTINDPAAAAPGGVKDDPRIILELEQAYAQQLSQKTRKKVSIPSYIENIEGTVEREVPPEGGVVDIDVKDRSPTASASLK